MTLFPLKKHVYRTIYLGAALLSLSGCASITTPYLDKSISWTYNEQRLQTLNNWSVQGKIGLQSPNTNGSASLDWQQHPQTYQIHLFGPLGMGSIYLNGNLQEVTLSNAQGQTLSASTPEALLAHIGWQLPVSNLLYWIRGLPIPGLPAKKIFAKNGTLQQLNQQGWQINYLSYQAIDGLWLPNKISLQSIPIKVKIIIHHWKLF